MNTITYETLRETYKRLFKSNMKMGLNHVEANFKAMETIIRISREVGVYHLIEEQSQTDSFYIPLIWADLGEEGVA